MESRDYLITAADLVLDGQSTPKTGDAAEAAPWGIDPPHFDDSWPVYTSYRGAYVFAHFAVVGCQPIFDSQE